MLRKLRSFFNFSLTKLILCVVMALAFVSAGLANPMPGLQAGYQVALPIVARNVVGEAIGALDPSFGSGGLVMTDIAGDDENGQGVAIQPDGKIVVAGYTYSGGYRDFALVRYNPDGSLDPSFGSNGLVVNSFHYKSDYGNAVVIQPDGKIIVVGTITDGSLYDFAVARFNSDGSLDTSFDGDGFVQTDFGVGGYFYEDHAYGVALQPDGKIVVVGSTFVYYDFSIARYNPDGSLDSSFGDGGKVRTAFGSYGFGPCKGVIIQDDGKIVAAGVASNGTDNDFALVRYMPDGSYDTSFDSDGLLLTEFSGYDDYANAIAIQGDDKLVVAGVAASGVNGDFALARYNVDGSLDISFGGDGKVTLDYITGYDEGSAVLIQQNGKIVVAGSVYNGTDYDFALVRYNSDGSLDTDFDGDGLLLTDFYGGDDYGASAALQKDGRIVIAGSADNGTDYDFAVASYK